jgi:hypothetical protein
MMEDEGASPQDESAPEAQKQCKGPCQRTLLPDSFRITRTYKDKAYRDSLCVDCRSERTKAQRRENAADMDKLLEQLVERARGRWQARKEAAEKKEVPFDEPFDITHAHFRELYDQQGRCCSLTKLPFIIDFHPNYDERPFAPSPDRIDPVKGYVKGNVRLVLWYVNRARSLFGSDILMLVAEAAVKNAIPQESLRDVEPTPLELMRALLNRPRHVNPWHDMSSEEKEAHNDVVNEMKDIIAAPDLTLYAVADPNRPNEGRVVGATFTRRSGEFVDTRPKPES